MGVWVVQVPVLPSHLWVRHCLADSRPVGSTTSRARTCTMELQLEVLKLLDL